MTRSTSHSPAPAAEPDDFSGQFQPLRQRLLAENGAQYLDVVGSLVPRYWRALLDILLGYTFLGLTVWLVGFASSTPAQLAATLLGALAVGYGVAFLQLFLHEAAHFNLARDRRRNDALCDALISWQVGTSVGRYRPVHFAHHRHLGNRADTENSYFQPLGPGLVIETLTGVHALRILRNRRWRLDRLPGQNGPGFQQPWGPLLRGMLLHLLVCTGAWSLSGWPGVACWVLGMAAFFPFFATLRQLLEHRSVRADPSVDYGQQDHGAVTRMFGTGPVASTFGGAGFNRHLLHHWEPQVSYTRLAELEGHLRGTCAGPIMAARRTTYVRTLAALWRARRFRALAHR